MNTWVQAAGKLFGDGALLGSGYAGGNLGKNPQGKNNPLMQAIHSVGPIPQGRYLIQGPPFVHPSAGPFCLRLLPCAGTDTFGRSGFMVHGDTPPPGNASEGCIVLPRPVREALWARVQAGDQMLTVVATEDQIPAVC